MQVQIRFADGGIRNEEINTTVDFVHEMTNTRTVGKMSFDFLDGSRLVLYSNGEYQILGTLVNYPPVIR